MAAAVAIAAGCAQPKQQAAPSVAWLASYDAALADAGKSGRPILLDFYTDW
jgi:thiol:disulfide interchange protein